MRRTMSVSLPEVDLDDAGILADRGGLALDHGPAAVQDVQPVAGAHHHGHVVLHEQDPAVTAPGEATDGGDELDGLRLVLPGGRLVEEEEPGAGGERPGDGRGADPTGGQAVRASGGHLAEAQLVDDLVAQPPSGTAARPRSEGGRLD